LQLMVVVMENRPIKSSAAVFLLPLRVATHTARTSGERGGGAPSAAATIGGRPAAAAEAPTIQQSPRPRSIGWTLARRAPRRCDGADTGWRRRCPCLPGWRPGFEGERVPQRALPGRLVSHVHTRQPAQHEPIPPPRRREPQNAARRLRRQRPPSCSALATLPGCAPSGEAATRATIHPVPSLKRPRPP
ncbi:unnamed protein product, partial [Prorocentrum cordatum]